MHGGRWIDEVKAIRLTDRAFHLLMGLAGGDIDQRGDWIRDRDAVNFAAVGRLEIEPSMDADARSSAGPVPWHDDVDLAAPRQ